LDSYFVRLGEISGPTERKTGYSRIKIQVSRFKIFPHFIIFCHGGQKQEKIIFRVFPHARQEIMVPTPFQSLKSGKVFTTLESDLRK
jgi:hypothetical protein